MPPTTPTRDRTKQASPPRPLMPRLPATSTPSIRSSTTPRLAAPHLRASPSSTLSNSRPYSSPNALVNTGSRITPADSTPVRAIASNVTPRSSARKSKGGSNNSTPVRPDIEYSGSTSPVRPSALGPGARFTSPRLGISEKSASDTNQRNGQAPGLTPVNQPRAFVSPPLSSNSQSETLGEPDVGASFFRAGDGPPPPQLERPAFHKKTSSFVYADGRRDSSMAGGGAAAHASATNQRSHLLQNIQRAQPPLTLAETEASAGYRSPWSDVPGFASPQGFAAIATRSPSPPKFDMHLSYRKGASQIIRPQVSDRSSPPRVFGSDFEGTNRRRRGSSLDTTSDPQEERYKSGSISSVGSAARSHAFQALPNGNSLTQSPKELCHSSRPQTAEQVKAFPDAVNSAMLASRGHSISSDHDAPEYLAARARRERKVLDLEISNSSLLAINRTLEREMRKQKAELRRLRRMTRNNARTSWLSEGSSATSAQYGDLDDIMDTDTLDGNDEEEEEEEDILSDEASDIASTAFSDDSLSPAALTQHDAKHLKEDQKRLRLDLAKHRELLIDSQKMNVSLRRCTGMTEQLIKDGNKALEYRVNTADIQLGGRVLSPEELDSKHAQQEAFSYFDRRHEEDDTKSRDGRCVAPDVLGMDVGGGNRDQYRLIRDSLSELEEEVF